MSQSHADITPTSPSPVGEATDGVGSHDVGKPKTSYGPRERGSILPGADREKGVGPRTQINMKLEAEIDAFNTLDEIYSFLKDVKVEDLSLFSEIIAKKFPEWQVSYQQLALLRLEEAERQAIEKGLQVDANLNPILQTDEKKWFRQTNPRRELGRRKDTLKKGQTTRFDKLKKLVADEAAGVQIKQEMDTLVLELKDAMLSLGMTDWDNLTPEQIKGALQKFVLQKSGHSQYIFQTAEELYTVYQYIEHAEKEVSLQLGYEILDEGKRPISFDLDKLEVYVVDSPKIPERKKQAFLDALKRIKLGTPDEVVDAMTTIGAIVGGAEILGPLINQQIINLGSWEPYVGAAAGVALETAFNLTWKYGIRKWYYNFPEGQGESATKFDLHFQNLSEELGSSSNPLRQMYRGDSKKAGKFLQACERYRASFAQAIYLDAPKDLEGWLNLNSGVLGGDTGGMRLPHRHKLKDNIDELLKLKYPKEGGFKRLTELSAKERQEVIASAWDKVAEEYGGKILDDLDEIIKARAQGKSLGDENQTNLQGLITNIETKGLYTKKEEISLDQAKQAMDEAQTTRDSIQRAQADYETVLKAMTGKRDELRTAELALIEAQRVQGHDTINVPRLDTAGNIVRDSSTNEPIIDHTESATGKIGKLREEERILAARRDEIYTLIGYDPTTGKYEKGRLFTAYFKAKAEANYLNAQIEYKRTRIENNKQQIAQLKNARGKKDFNAIDRLTGENNDINLEIVELNGKLLTNQQILTPLADKYTPLAEELEETKTNIRKIPLNIKTELEVIDTSQAAYEKATYSLNYALVDLRQKLLTLGFTAEQIKQFDQSQLYPSADSVQNRIIQAEAEFQKKKKEYEELQAKKEKGDILELSDRDKEIVAALNKLHDSKIFDVNIFDKIRNGILNRDIDPSILAKVVNDEGYHLILKTLFGDDALTPGPEGNYQLVSKIVSKTRLAETVIEAWDIAGRATKDEFFQGDEAGFNAYQGSVTLAGEISRLNADLQNFETQGNQAEADRVRSEIAIRQQTRDHLMAELYDSRLAGFWSLDSGKASQAFGDMIVGLYDDAMKGNVFHEVMAISATGPVSETMATNHGTITISETRRNSITLAIVDRGRVVARNVGGPGFSVEASLSANDPASGNIEVRIPLDKNQTTLDQLPDTLPADLYPLLDHLLYTNDIIRRRSDFDQTLFTQAILDSLPDTRNDALGAGFNVDSLLHFIYGDGPADPKRNLADILTDLTDSTKFKMNLLPHDEAAFPLPATFDPDLKNIFYEQGEFRRTVAEIDAFIASLPAARSDAATTGAPVEFLDYFYEAATTGGAKKDLGGLAEITMEFTHFDSNALLILLGQLPPDRDGLRPDYKFYESLAEGVSSVDYVTRGHLLGTRYRETTLIAHPDFKVAYRDGYLFVSYKNEGDPDYESYTMTEFIKGPYYGINTGAYMASSHDFKSKLIQAVGMQILDAMRNTV